MDLQTVQAAILLADISGSTQLYETVGDAEAQRLIGLELARLEAAILDAGGTYIRQKGDDVLGHFAQAGGAFAALRTMLSRKTEHVLAIHAGLHQGQVVLARDDIFGEAVILTARLAALANAGEALLSRSCVDRLSEADKSALKPLDRLRLKGIATPIEVFSYTDDDTAMRTRMLAGGRGGSLPAEVTAVLTHDERAHRCREAESLAIGRSRECDLVLDHPWVSRRHATVTVRDGKVLLDDRSSSGTYVVIGGGHPLLLKREAMTLAGTGIISPALPPTRAEAVPIPFEVIEREA